jgi:hypothetical protein
MRAGIVVSALAHLAAFAVGYIAWPEPRPPEIAPETAVVPVDIVEFAERSNVAPIAAPKPPDAQEEIAVEGAPQQLAEAAPTPALQIPPEPAPDQKNAPKKDPSLNLDQLALLIDKKKKEAGEKPDPASAAAKPADTGERPRRAIGAGDDFTVSEKDAIRAQMRECWRMPIDMATPEKLIVKVRAQFDASGRLTAPPQLVNPASLAGLDPPSRVAAEAALRAVRLCDPLRVSPTRTVGGTATLNFDPREMINP